jgi:hypothetical protein
MLIRNSASAIMHATLEFFRQWKALVITTAIYALFLIAIYAFVTTREATSAQVVLTVALTIATPLLFFTLQTATTNYATACSGRKFIMTSLLNSWKLFVVSLPVIILTTLFVYLLNKIQARYLAGAISTAVDPYIMAGSGEVSRPIQWGVVSLTSLRYLLLGVLAPLSLIHLWLGTSHDGLISSFRGFLTHLTRAFTARSVLIYITGFLIFAVVPYFLLFKTVATTRAWLELALFSARLIAVFCLTLFGWIITVRAQSLAKESASLAAKVA